MFALIRPIGEPSNLCCHISKEGLGLRDGKRERAVRVTFDEVLKPAVEAWKAGLPYIAIWCLTFQSTRSTLSRVGLIFPSAHARISPFVVGWSSDSDREVDVVK